MYKVLFYVSNYVHANGANLELRSITNPK